MLNLQPPSILQAVNTVVSVSSVGGIVLILQPPSLLQNVNPIAEVNSIGGNTLINLKPLSIFTGSTSTVSFIRGNSMLSDLQPTWTLQNVNLPSPSVL